MSVPLPLSTSNSRTDALGDTQASSANKANTKTDDLLSELWIQASPEDQQLVLDMLATAISSARAARTASLQPGDNEQFKLIKFLRGHFLTG